VVLCNNPAFSCKAQIPPLPWRKALKRKYFPSGVHAPQHSPGSWCHSARRRRGLPPSLATSHREFEPLFRSKTLKRTCTPSGENLSAKGSPPKVASLRASLPSDFSRKTSSPLLNTSSCPSGEKAAP